MSTERLDQIEARLAARRTLPCSDCTDDVTCACCDVDAEMTALVAFVRAVESLHVREVIAVHEFGPEAACLTCQKHWPCPTAAAVEKLGGAA